MSKLGDKHWTSEQVECLRDGYANDVPIEELVHYIGKTPDAIRTKAMRLDIKYPIELLPEGFKRCPCCSGVKEIKTGFHDGQSWCKICQRAATDKWARANKERLRKYYYVRVARDPDEMQATRARGSHKQRALFKNGHDLTAEQWQHILEEHNQICPVCRRAFTETDPPERDCIVAVCEGGRLTASNVQPLHMACNRRKELIRRGKEL